MQKVHEMHDWPCTGNSYQISDEKPIYMYICMYSQS